MENAVYFFTLFSNAFFMGIWEKLQVYDYMATRARARSITGKTGAQVGRSFSGRCPRTCFSTFFYDEDPDEKELNTESFPTPEPPAPLQS